MRTLLLLVSLSAAAANAQDIPEIGSLMSADRDLVQGPDSEMATDWGFTDDCGNVFFYVYSDQDQEVGDKAVVRIDGEVHELRQNGDHQEFERRGSYGTLLRFESPDGAIGVRAFVMWNENEGGDCGYGTGGIAVTAQGQEITRDLSIQACSAVYGAY